MIQKAVILSLLVYFVAGTLLLPLGDFSTLVDLPHMYQHCHDTEDPDMNIPDFIVEHLLQLDDDMGEVQDGSEPEKPHQPMQFSHFSAPITITARLLAVKIEQPSMDIGENIIVSNDVYLSDYPASVFRPPIMD